MLTLVTDWFLPSKVKVVLRRLLSKFIGFNRVDSWQTAKRNSVGYESDQVIQPVVEAATQLRVDQLSTKMVTSRYQQVATAMLYCFFEERSQDKKPWRVLDFGGGGGDYFYQFKKFAPNATLDWTVVETPTLSEAMTLQNEGDKSQIKWVDSLAKTEKSYDVILCSSVLQYVEYPFEILDALAEKTKYIILNRIPLVDTTDHFVTLQRIISNRKRGSYPAHFFSEEKFMTQLEIHGSVPMRWMVQEDQPVIGWKTYPNQGMLLHVKKRLGDE